MTGLFLPQRFGTPYLSLFKHALIRADDGYLLKLVAGLQRIEHVRKHVQYERFALALGKIGRKATLCPGERFYRNECSVSHIVITTGIPCYCNPAASKTLRASTALAAASRMMVSVATAGMPRSSIASSKWASCSSTTITSRKSR